MQVYRKVEEYKGGNSVITIGSFDGVHIGHKEILKQVLEFAKEKHLQSLVFTFWPHPRKIIAGESEVPQLLTSLSEKSDELENLGIDHLIVSPFTREFSETNPEDFIKSILVGNLKASVIVIGYDHRFGKNREGDITLLKSLESTYGYKVVEISKQMLETSAINSTSIRKFLLEGSIESANEMLGRSYSICGIVVKGQQIGRTIGFPTANIEPDDKEKLIPGDGVYAVNVIYKGQILSGMMNIGNRPTVNGINRTIEVHILNFNKEIYGEKLIVKFVKKIRDQRKFSGLEELKEQLRKDKITTASLLITE